MWMAKIQTGLRLPGDRYEELLKIAKDSGTSVNSVALLLIELGLNVIRLGNEEVRRELIHSLKDNS